MVLEFVYGPLLPTYRGTKYRDRARRPGCSRCAMLPRVK